MRPQRIAVVGMGYVGLTSAAALAWIGHEVWGIEIDRTRLERLRRRQAPFFEPNLEPLLAAVGPRLHFTDALNECMPDVDIVMLAVGTPPQSDGSADLSYLWTAVDQIARSLPPNASLTVVNKSTAPVGTLHALRRRLPSSVAVACNPEFLRQGHALVDTLCPDRIVVGTDEAEAAERICAMYEPILAGTAPMPADVRRPADRVAPRLLTMDPASAELAKYAANAFLATKISFINEIANVCDRVGADVALVADVLGADRRIGPHYLQAGVGYGGSCFPKDTRALRQLAGRGGYDFKLLGAVIEVNQAQALTTLRKLEAHLGSLAQRRIAVLGLAFKPGTDDLREAPSIAIIRALVRAGAVVAAHDPLVWREAKLVLPEGVTVHGTVAEAVEGADAVLLVTEWDQYRAMGPDALKPMAGNLIIDGRNALDPALFPGFRYEAIGRHARDADTAYHQTAESDS